MKTPAWIEEEKSEYQDFGYLRRLNIWFLYIGMAKQNTDANAWLLNLCNIFSELSTHMKEEDVNKWKLKINELNSMIKKEEKKHSILGRGEGGITPNVFQELLTFELFIRKIYKESGLETKLSESAQYALR